MGFWNGLCHSVRVQQSHYIVALATTLALTGVFTSLSGPGVAAETALPAETLIRTVPLDISGYTEGTDIDTQVKSADTTVALLAKAKPLLIHMEAIRRAYIAFGDNPVETKKLMATLKTRYMKDQENAVKFLDYGYAQLVMQNDKNGLFFLRKANDKLKSPATNLAYGLAQIDIDKNQEGAPTDAVTTRKMDVGYKLKDALILNKTAHLTGIWPSYVNIVQAIKDFQAYDGLRTEDVSVIYVPYGSTSLEDTSSTIGNGFLAMEASQKTDAPEDADTSWVDTTCTFSKTPIVWTQLTMNKSIDINHDGKPELVNFFQQTADKTYQIKVLNDKNQLIGEMQSPKAPYIFEDLNGDKQFAIVVRQFDLKPYDPVHVYRWNGKCIQEDKRAISYFK